MKKSVFLSWTTAKVETVVHFVIQLTADGYLYRNFYLFIFLFSFISVKMELNKVQPDEEMGDLIINIFGKYSTVFKRYLSSAGSLTSQKNSFTPVFSLSSVLHFFFLFYQQVAVIDLSSSFHVYAHIISYVPSLRRST
jgi:hypothetical protein